MASKNPDLTRKLLHRWEQKSGEKILSDRERKLVKEETQRKIVTNPSDSKEKQVLTEAQVILIDIKSKFPALTQHTETAYMQLGQIIKLMEKRKEDDRRPQTI
jgi:hypothetical protein